MQIDAAARAGRAFTSEDELLFWESAKEIGTPASVAILERARQLQATEYQTRGALISLIGCVELLRRSDPQAFEQLRPARPAVVAS